MLMTSPQGTQESGVGGLQGGMRAGGSDTRKAPSTAANEEVTWGRHGVRPWQGGETVARRKMR